MNIRHLEHLLALAETGSFSRAAERLFITQSALSRSLQTLEDELGGRLLDRVGRRNELTPLGRDVVSRAQRIVQDAAELRRSAELLQQGDSGILQVGLGSGPGAVLMNPLLHRVATGHSRLRVSITRGSTELQLVQLRARQLDALVVDVHRVVPAPDLAIEEIGEQAAGFVCRAGHPLAAVHPVSLPDVLRYPLASTPLSGEVARRLVSQYGPLAHPSEMVRLQCDEIASLLDTVRGTDTIFLGILAAARRELACGEFVELDLHPRLQVSARFAYVTLAGRTEAPAMRLFRGLVQEHLASEACGR